MTSSRLLPVVYVGKSLILTRTEAWVWVRLPHTNTFMSPTSDHETVANTLASALRATLDESNEPVAFHLRNVNHAFDVQAWYDQLTTNTATYNPPPAAATLAAEAAQRLETTSELSLLSRTYLGVCLGQRDTTSNLNALKSSITALLKRASDSACGPDLGVAATELQQWGDAGRKMQHTLASALSAKTTVHADDLTVSPAELMWLLRKPFYPTYGCPDVDIPTLDPDFTGDTIIELTPHDITSHPRHLDIAYAHPVTGTEEHFHTTVACLTDFSRTNTWPQNLGWAQLVQDNNPNVEWSVRGRIIPASMMKERIQKNTRVINQELDDSYQSGMEPGRYLTEQHEESSDLEHGLSQSSEPWLEVTYRMQLRGATTQELDQATKNLQTALQQSNLRLYRPPHDQLPLLTEFIPGSPWLENLYKRTQSHHYVGAGGLTASYHVGDDTVLGPYLGRVLYGDTPPVFFDPNRAPAINQPPVVSVTGSPGTGKTFLALSLAYQCAARGYHTVYIDPKADAVPFASLPGLGDVTLFNLADGADGMLDPFRLGDNVEASGILALEVLSDLTGGRINEQRETALSNAINRIKTTPNPSLWAVVDHLASFGEGTPEYNLAALFNTMKRVPFGRLLFAENPDGPMLAASDGLTVVTLLGLELAGSDTPPEDRTYGQRIGSAVMFLLTRYALGLMRQGDRNFPKALFVDEAWAVLGTKAGKSMSEEIARMGRSHNTSLVLITQNVADFAHTSIGNQVSTRFVFGSSDPHEHPLMLEYLDVDQSAENLTAVSYLTRQDWRGRCLMKDPLGRVGLIQVDPYRQDLFEAFNTNPATRKIRPADARAST